MISPEQIPDEVVKAFEEEYHFGEGDWKRNAIAAAINAWPGMAVNDGCPVWHAYPHIILPLPQEARDE